MSWLDKFLSGLKNVQVNGAPMAQQPTIDFVGSVTGANDPVNLRTIITLSAQFAGGGAAVSGALGTLTPNSFLTIDLSGQDSTATLPTMTADGFVAIMFSAGNTLQPKKATITGNGLAPGFGNIDAAINAGTNQGLCGDVQFSSTGQALFFWNNAKGFWIQS